MRSVVFLVLCLTALASAKPRDFSAVDRHALAATPKDESSIKSLAAYLKQNRPRSVWNPSVHFQTRNALGDEDTAREIFRWIAERITYDYAAIALSWKKDLPTQILECRHGVCHDYAILYEALGKEAGLDVEYVLGSVMIDGVRQDHAWNAVNIGGEWRMIDSCWASKNGTWPKYQQDFQPKWFTMPPEQFVESHIPSDAAYYWNKAFMFPIKQMDQKRLSQIRRAMGLGPRARDPLWDD